MLSADKLNVSRVARESQGPRRSRLEQSPSTPPRFTSEFRDHRQLQSTPHKPRFLPFRDDGRNSFLI